MNKQEFLNEVPHIIFKEVAKNTNQLIGISKTSAAIANLFTILPMQVELRHMSNQPKPTKKLNALNEFVHAYIKHDDASKVHIAFFYKSEKQLTRIRKAVDKHPAFFAYLYMREALKLTRLMNTKTHYKMMSGIIRYNNPSIPVTEHYRLSIAACNHAVDTTIKSLFKGSPIADKLDKISEHITDFHKYSSISEMDIVKQMVQDPDLVGTASEQLDDEFEFNPYSNQLFGKGLTEGSIPINESIQTDLGESVSNQFGFMSRGTGSAAVFGKLFAAKKVKTGWFKKLASKFTRDVYYMTNTFTSQWSSLNITYRHKFKAPKAQYTDNKLAVVLSIDHSASVATEGLQQLLYLFQKHSKRITKLIVLIHDTEVVREFNIDSDYNIASNPDFKQALAHRFAAGGTSHLDVFRRISELIKDKSIDPEKSIYISFSDNYSDIPESWKEFPAVRKLSTTFLAPLDNPVNVKGTTDIAMQ